MNIKEAFQKHIDNEFPPKFAFYALQSGELGSVWLSQLNLLERSHEVVGMTHGKVEFKHLKKAGNLPILKRKD